MSLLSSEMTACALLDLVEIGPAMRIRNLTLVDMDQFRHKLALSGILNVKRSNHLGPGWIMLDISTDIDGVIATATAELNIVPTSSGDYQMTQRSRVRLSPLSYLAACGVGGAARITFDGSTNYIGSTPTDSRPLLEQQHRYVAAMMEELTRRLRNALPPGVVFSEENTRLRRIELCRDTADQDSLGAALLLAHSVLRETRWIERDVYRAGSTDDQGSPVTRWWRKKEGVAYKVYAKAPSDEGRLGCVRQEVSCQGRKALKELACDTRVAWTSEGVTSLLRSFVTAALPLLESLHRHVAEVLAGSAAPSDLFVALSPLVLPMSGAATGGRPTSPEQLTELRNAFDLLVVTGRYRGKGLKKGLTLRSLFDKLCGLEGALQKHPSLCLYSVKPQFIRASHALADRKGAERALRENS